MANSAKKWFRKFVVFMAKPIPGKTPFWPIVLGTTGIGLSWTFIPYVFWHPFKTVPWFKTALNMLPFNEHLPYILPYILPVIISIVCLMPICRGIQILDPDEFDLYNDD